MLELNGGAPNKVLSIDKKISEQTDQGGGK